MWKALNEHGRETRTLELLLRIGVAGCFIGHGAFGVIGKEAWLPYFAVAGIGETWAWRLMPLVGSVDILVGILTLLAPRPAYLAYAAVWATWTALLRPLAGESVFETLERAGNYGVPIAFLVFAAVAVRPTANWLRTMDVPPLTPRRRTAVMNVLRATTALLLAGHGGLALQGKALLAAHASMVGLPEGGLALVGAFELALAAAIAVRPAAGLLVVAIAWKLGTEALYPIAGAPFWEFVERAGSYVAPLTLLVMVRRDATVPMAARVRPAALLGVAALVAGAFASVGQPATAQDAELLRRLRSGGLVVACRHAITDRSRGDARRVDFEDRATQRVLSEAGERQARAVGTTLRELGIPFDEVLTSPYFRTADSAELTFGRAERSDALFSGGRSGRAALAALIWSRPAGDTNRALMTHQGVLYSAFPDVDRGSIREGDCLVVDPEADRSSSVLARLGPDEWAELDGAEAGRAGPPDPVRAAVAGGTVMLCRHAITGSFREREPVDYRDVSTQRRLDDRGRRQSRAIGDALRRLGVEIAQVVASPMDRAIETAELMTGRTATIEPVWHTNGGRYDGESLVRRRAILATPVPVGNVLVVSHIGTIASVIPKARGELGEGDCAVVRAEAGGFEVVGFVDADGWRIG